MIIVVLEYPEDGQPQNWLIDLSLVDSQNKNHMAYKEAIDKALLDEDDCAEMSSDYSVTYSEYNVGDLVIEYPAQVDNSVTLYID